MLESGKKDLAVIASPTTCHAEQTIRSLEGGAHVFCDKPAALNAAEFMCMGECAARCRRKLTVYPPQRFTAESLTFQEILGGGKLGPLFGVKLFCGHPIFRVRFGILISLKPWK